MISKKKEMNIFKRCESPLTLLFIFSIYFSFDFKIDLF